MKIKRNRKQFYTLALEMDICIYNKKKIINKK